MPYIICSTIITGNGNAKNLDNIINLTDDGYIITGGGVVYDGDIYILRIDKDGGTLWTASYGGPHQDYSTCVISLPDSTHILTGYTYHLGNPDFEQNFQPSGIANGL